MLLCHPDAAVSVLQVHVVAVAEPAMQAKLLRWMAVQNMYQMCGVARGTLLSSLARALRIPHCAVLGRSLLGRGSRIRIADPSFCLHSLVI